MKTWTRGFGMVLSKQEAAAYLGVSDRTLARYVQQGKLSCRYEKGKTRTVAVFDESELENLKAELEEIVHRPAIDSDNLDNLDASLTEFDVVLPERQFELLVEVLSKQRSHTLPHNKMLLTLPEAQELTGLSRGVLRANIRDNKLKAERVGRAWRIKPKDLEIFVEKLF